MNPSPDSFPFFKEKREEDRKRKKESLILTKGFFMCRCFFHSSALFLICLVFLLSVDILAQTVLTAFPKTCQLYSRDVQDSAITPIIGAISSAGAESVSVTLYSKNIQVKRLPQALQYSGATASFNFSPKIHAELSMYKYELRIDETLINTADSVVCGDAFLVEGQSNTCSEYDDGYVPLNPYVRAFGKSYCNDPDCWIDTTWGIALGCNDCSNLPDGHYVNKWGLRIAQKIADNHSIPVCLFTGCWGWTSIESHYRDTAYNSIYGNFLYRIKKANLADGLKWVIWHQGESNPSDTDYKEKFLGLCNTWKSDFPGIQRYYLFQIRSCNNNWGELHEITREQQRRIPEGRPDISIMSTTNIPGNDGCHYSSEGYQLFAERMYPLIARDFYGLEDTVRITPPNIQKAWFEGIDHLRLKILFDQPVLLPDDSSIQHAFGMGSTVSAADSVRADTNANTITLFLGSPSDSTTVSYYFDDWNGDVYFGPWLYNTRGIGALGFYRFPITEKDSTAIETSLPSPLYFGLTAFPNPFAASMLVKFNVPQSKNKEKQKVYVRIYDLNGKLVQTLVQGMFATGYHRVVFKGRESGNGQTLGNGFYFCRMQAPGFERTLKMLLVQ